MNKQIAEETRKDLEDDFEELMYLFSSTLKQLQTFRKDLLRQKKHILSFDLLLEQTKEYEKKYEEIIRKLKRILDQVENDKKERFWSSRRCPSGYQNDERNKYYDLYRSLQSIVAGLITSADWQSPSFNYSMKSLAGRQTGKIMEHINDYKRDRHLDAYSYETRFRNAYIEGLFTFPIHVYVTNSGMAAFTTALQFLVMEKKITSPVMLGKSAYFENKQIAKKTVTKPVHEFDEHDTTQFCKSFDELKPSVIILDSLCNSFDMALPNIRKMFRYITDTARHDVFIILDNTNLASTFQPMKLIKGKNTHVRLIVIESMNKYYEFGIDKTTGGIIYTWGKDTLDIHTIREHLGTNIPDIACYMLPLPNKKLLEKRLSRFERNVSSIIETLTESIQKTPKTPLKNIVYPTLSTHPAKKWTRDLSFHGSFFTFAWKPKYNTIRMYKRFISNVLEEASKQEINIVAGTSFGMNTSRIYLTSSRSYFGKPFVRFSVGTETTYEIEKIKDVLIKAIEKL